MHVSHRHYHFFVTTHCLRCSVTCCCCLLEMNCRENSIQIVALVHICGSTYADLTWFDFTSSRLCVMFEIGRISPPYSLADCQKRLIHGVVLLFGFVVLLSVIVLSSLVLIFLNYAFPWGATENARPDITRPIKIVGTDIARLDNARPYGKGGHTRPDNVKLYSGWTARDLFQCSSELFFSFK